MSPLLEKAQKSEKVVSVRHVSKCYDGAQKETPNALSDVSFDIYRGEILSILGPNGAGKTTLINMMLGQLSLSSGDMKLLGCRPGEIELKRQCGAMLQVSGLPDMSTVKEHIQLFRSYYANPMSYAKVIDIAGLAEIENKYSKNISGGQKQRLLFGLAICGNPKLLFLDEPTVGLDISARRSLWQAITDLKDKGCSIVLTTHYLEEADQLSDRIIMLNQGRVIKTGTPTEIKSQIDSKIIRFSASSELHAIDSIASARSVIVKTNSSGEQRYEIQSSNPVLTLRELFSMDLDIADLTVSGAALEDAFLSLNEITEQSSQLDLGATA